MSVFAQDDVESRTPFRAQHLMPITLAYRRNLIGENNTALEQVQPSEELDTARHEVSLGQIRQAKIEAPETSLFRDMMDREDRGEGKLLMVDQRGHQSRGPIMHVQNLRRRRHPSRQFERRFGKENETLGVVVVGDTMLAINSRAIEKLVAANKKSLHPAGRPAFDKF